MSDDELGEYPRPSTSKAPKPLRQCLKGFSAMLMFAGSAILAVSFRSVVYEEDGFVSMLIGGFSLLFFGMFFLCSALCLGGPYNKRDETEDEQQEAISMRPTVTGVEPPSLPESRHDPFATAPPDYHLNRGSAQGYSSNNQSSLQEYTAYNRSAEESVSVLNGRAGALQANENASADRSRNSHRNTPYEDLPPSYESVMANSSSYIIRPAINPNK